MRKTNSVFLLSDQKRMKCKLARPTGLLTKPDAVCGNYFHISLGGFDKMSKWSPNIDVAVGTMNSRSLDSKYNFHPHSKKSWLRASFGGAVRKHANWKL